jgi:glucose/arabinose dehydrogenase
MQQQRFFVPFVDRALERTRHAAVCLLLFVASASSTAQPNLAGDLTDFMVFDTFTPGPCSPNGQAHGACPPGERLRIRVAPVVTGLTNPWHIAFLPEGGGMLVTEGTGALKIVRQGQHEAANVAGWPAQPLGARNANSVIVHPDFAANRFLYLTYMKERADGMTTIGLARGRLDGAALTNVRDVFVADAWVMGGPLASRAAFGPDGMIYMTVNDHDRLNATSDSSIRMLAQDLGSDVGKVLRITDTGGIPPDNPFVGRADASAAVYTYGHRNVTGFAWHPQSGELWATEIGPMGGDELNVLRPGRNYGWPLVSLGKIYNDSFVSEQSWWRPGMEMPVMHWSPSISPIGLTFYTGDLFPEWRGHLFMGALNGQMLQRVAFDQPPPQSERRESLLTELDARVRHVAQGPDGAIYVAVERRPGGTLQPIAELPGNGAVLRIERAD